MSGGNIRLAVSALRSTRWRTALTILGIAIGIVAVITTVSLGEGLKHQVREQIHKLGSDIVIIRPGTVLNRDVNGRIVGLSMTYVAGFGAGSLRQNDLDVVSKTANVASVVPMSFVTGIATSELDKRSYDKGFIIGTSSDFAEVIDQKINYGKFFDKNDNDKRVAVIGKNVAEQLFQQNVPIGRTLSIRGQDFVVRAVFDNFVGSNLVLGADFNSAIVIPYQASKDLGADSQQIVQILVKPNKYAQTSQVTKDIIASVKNNHEGQDDFTVLGAYENFQQTNKFLNVVTGFIAGVASISLLVGGIGIMNIMLVAVTERTREIGIRKAIGATNRQILRQFLTEAMVLSIGGGIVGVIGAFLVNYFLQIFTDLTPIISWPTVVFATGISVFLGVVFGTAPAIKAARKNPIDALRYE